MAMTTGLRFKARTQLMKTTSTTLNPLRHLTLFRARHRSGLCPTLPVLRTPALPGCVHWAIVILALVVSPQLLRASDPIGIYAFVDKVVFEPNADKPERIQVWGGFALAEGYGYTYA